MIAYVDKMIAYADKMIAYVDKMIAYADKNLQTLSRRFVREDSNQNFQEITSVATCVMCFKKKTHWLCLFFIDDLSINLYLVITLQNRHSYKQCGCTIATKHYINNANILCGQNDSIRGQNDSIRGQNDSIRGQNDSIRGQNDSIRGQKLADPFKKICPERFKSKFSRNNIRGDLRDVF